MKRKACIIFMLFLPLLFTTCKKFQYDESLTIQKADETRLVGNWDLEMLYIDGKDSTSAAKSQPCYGYFSFVNESNEGFSGSLYVKPFNLQCGGYGAKYVSIEGNYLVMRVAGNSTDYTPVGPYRADSDLKLYIYKLTSDDLWLETTYQGRYCFIRMKKV